MNWISNYMKPKINSIFSRRETPDNLWTKCKECGAMLFHRELADNLNVCINCDHHMNITPRDRCMSMFDGSVFEEFKAKDVILDPLKFKDQKKYTDRIKDARKKTGEDEAMFLAKGKMGRTQVVVAVQDFSFMGGSMGMGVGNAIIAACEQALKLKCPLILFSAAGGARMQEGPPRGGAKPKVYTGWRTCVTANLRCVFCDLRRRAGGRSLARNNKSER